MDKKQIKIAVIDDEKQLVDAIKGLLEPRDFTVLTAYDGKNGFRTVLQEKPDLVILDIMMPGMDGRDMLKQLKHNSRTRDIPVIMLTAKVEQFERDYGLELGAYEYLTKPYDSHSLLRQINNVLEKRT